MGGAESKDVRTEEKREDPPAKRRVITKLKSMEERLAFIELNLWHHDQHSPFYRKLFLDGGLTSFFFPRENVCPGGPFCFGGYSNIPFTMGALEEAFRSLKLQVEANKRYEEKREDPPAKRREITKLESMEERLVFIEWNHWPHEPGPGPGPHILSRSSTIPFTMSGVEEDEWTEEESEAASAKRREIRKLESMEERLAFIEQRLRHHFRRNDPFFFPRECLRHHVCPRGHFFFPREDLWHHDPDPNIISRTEEETKEAAMELQNRTLKLMEEYMAFRRQRLSSLERGPFIPPRAEEKRKDSAKEREIRKLKLMEEYMAFRRQYLSSLEPGPIIFSSRTEKKREAARAKRRVLRELKLMEESIALIRTEEKREDSAKRREIMELVSMEESIALIRKNIMSLNIFPSERSFGFSAEEEEADSPALSCDSIKRCRSMDFPFSFKRALSDGDLKPLSMLSSGFPRVLEILENA